MVIPRRSLIILQFWIFWWGHCGSRWSCAASRVAMWRREWRCGVESGDVSPMDISWPTEVRHVSHVTFDQFNGFLSLPTEFELEVPRKAPSARLVDWNSGHSV
ncbi:hypothetical protein SLEP1_g25227 [Rubroshorea leprosula]|uniref:CRIB domain-containing protein n=1 Tax=Rubroshorea leprosula TaxID=152421 RepID=A0AAV5JNK9_9ROSI|nr:hypothetical protein SLEP1_g25227 [Rubroshorea leprosula]